MRARRISSVSEVENLVAMYDIMVISQHVVHMNLCEPPYSFVNHGLLALPYVSEAVADKNGPCVPRGECVVESGHSDGLSCRAANEL